METVGQVGQLCLRLLESVLSCCLLLRGVEAVTMCSPMEDDQQRVPGEAWE